MMTDDAVRRLMAASLHDDRTQAQPADAIRYEQGEYGYMTIHLNDWALDYFDHDAPMVLKQNGAEILLYESDIDTLMELLQRARFNMRGEA